MKEKYSQLVPKQFRGKDGCVNWTTERKVALLTILVKYNGVCTNTNISDIKSELLRFFPASAKKPDTRSIKNMCNKFIYEAKKGK